MKTLTSEEYIAAKKAIKEYEQSNEIKEDVFPYNIHVGDTIAHVCNCRSHHGLLSVVVTEELLENILKYETTENYHQFRIMKKYNEE